MALTRRCELNSTNLSSWHVCSCLGVLMDSFMGDWTGPYAKRHKLQQPVLRRSPTS